MREQRLAKPVSPASGGPCRALDGRRVAVCKLLIILDDTRRDAERRRGDRPAAPQRAEKAAVIAAPILARTYEIVGHGALDTELARPRRRGQSRAPGGGVEPRGGRRAVTFLATLLIGIVAGSRSMMAPAAVAWAARLGWIDLGATWASFMGSLWAVLALLGPGAGRARHRPAADHPEPQGAGAVRRPHRLRRLLRRRARGRRRRRRSSASSSARSARSPAPSAAPSCAGGWRRPSAPTGRRR